MGKPEVIWGQKSSSEKLRERGSDALGTGCPKTPSSTKSQVTDSMWPEQPGRIALALAAITTFADLDAHKE